MLLEKVRDFYLTPSEQFFSYIMTSISYIFDVMMMMSALYYTNMLSWIFIVLAFWNTTPILLHSRHIIQTPSQPVFALNP